MSTSDTPTQGDAQPPEAAPPASESIPPASPEIEELKPPAAEASNVIESVTCPSCDAVLRNVSVQPGATVRCLNCGKKFTPAGASAAPDAAAINAPAQSKAPLGREPRAAGYWLLRIPAILYLTGTLFGFAIMILNASSVIPFSGFQNLIWLSYWPLIPAAGTLVFLLTRSMARIDASGVFLAWRSGVISDSLPPVTGSSLPYIAPLAITGGALPIFCIRAFPDDSGAAVVGAIYGALLFYAGFALEDVRQFIWRQETLAKKSCERMGVDTSLINEHEIVGGTGLLLGGVFVSAAIVILSIVFESYSWRSNNREAVLPIFLAIGIGVISVSMTILGMAWDRAVAWWQLAAGIADKLQSGDEPIRYIKNNMYIWEKVVNKLPDGMRRMVLAPIIWTLCGAIWMSLMVLSNEIRVRGWEMSVMLFSCIGGACLACWMARFLAQLARWRRVQEKVWRHFQLSSKPVKAATNPFYMTVVSGIAILAFIECGLFSIFIADNVLRFGRFNLETIGLPLLLFMMHYPTLWFAVVLRQALSLETFLAGRQKTGSDDNTVEIENTELA
jgi:hypothetical protein